MGRSRGEEDVDTHDEKSHDYMARGSFGWVTNTLHQLRNIAYNIKTI